MGVSPKWKIVIYLDHDGRWVTFQGAKLSFIIQYTRLVLQRSGGVVSDACRLAQRDRKELYKDIRKARLNLADFRKKGVKKKKK